MEGPAALVQEFINGQSPRLTSQLHLSPCCLHGTRRCAHAPYSVQDTREVRPDRLRTSLVAVERSLRATA